MFEESDQPLPVTITFHKTEPGEIPFTVACGVEAVEFNASESFDPFPNMLRWLEAITTGVWSCSFPVFEPNREKELTYQMGTLLITDEYGKKVFLRAEVDPVQLVASFYHSLQAYAQSSLYIKTFWQAETLADRLANQTRPPRSRRAIKETLLRLDRVGLQDTLFLAVPSYDVTFPGIADLEERSSMELFHLFDPDGAKKIPGSRVRPVHWEIRTDYDRLSVAEKTDYLNELLWTELCGSQGWALGEISSEVVEQWLHKHEGR